MLSQDECLRRTQLAVARQMTGESRNLFGVPCELIVERYDDRFVLITSHTGVWLVTAHGTAESLILDKRRLH